MPFPRKNKYRVSPKADRTWNGKVYASKAEMFFAQMLHRMQLNGEVRAVVEQPVVMLDCIKYIPDFLVTYNDGAVMYIDVKGVSTPVFSLKLKLWKQHGPGKLRLVKQSGAPSKLTGLVKFKDLGTYGPGVAK
jgi:hypothetical protein